MANCALSLAAPRASKYCETFPKSEPRVTRPMKRKTIASESSWCKYSSMPMPSSWNSEGRDGNVENDSVFAVEYGRTRFIGVPFSRSAGTSGRSLSRSARSGVAYQACSS